MEWDVMHETGRGIQWNTIILSLFYTIHHLLHNLEFHPSSSKEVFFHDTAISTYAIA
jgi:hypothetical protein